MFWRTVLAGTTFAFLLPLAAFKDSEPALRPDAETELGYYPKDYFIRPIGDALRLTGTFGELRNNHFHSGIDIKSSTGGVGQPVYAAADGFVDRIKVEESGYGNALYIKHPNGYTTVYAHLDRFSPEIEAYVRAQQYTQESFEVDLNPADGRFPCGRGQEIGKLGNTGGSTGPHLHFEIRHTASGRVLNPLLFGLPVTDNLPPDIRDMKVYFLAEDRSVLHSKAFPVSKLAAGRYGIAGDTATLGAWRVGFGVKTYDQLNGLKNDNGVYAIELYVDGALTYGWRTDDLSFKETRYLNAHVDYSAKKRYGAWFNRLFVLPGNRLSGYQQTATMGLIALHRDKVQQVLIKVFDASGNASEVRFQVRRSEEIETPPAQSYNQEMPWNTENVVQYDGFYLRLPKGVLYENLLFHYHTTPDNSLKTYSSVHHVHYETTPAHQYFDLALRPYGLPAELQAKAVIAKCDTRKPVNCGGALRSDGMLYTRVRNFGDYCVMVDDVAPTITPVLFSENMRGQEKFVFRITDNFETEAQARNLHYRGAIDGKWVLFEFDAKRDRLSHTFDKNVAPGEHVLRLEVFDDRNNLAVFEKTFTR
ncbi:MAG: M23 family metallopeptidase [Saprospiraceae bacterium]|nr:M23 family metallopeptidase [Saprospiraceae bacterium]